MSVGADTMLEDCDPRGSGLVPIAPGPLVVDDPTSTVFDIAQNGDATADWLRNVLTRPESALERKLGTAIRLAAEELRFGSGVVHLVVQASGWTPFQEIVVYRAPEPGIPAGLHILSMDAFEATLWRPPHTVKLMPDLRRRHRPPVLVVLRRSELPTADALTTWELMLHAASAVRERMSDIERV